MTDSPFVSVNHSHGKPICLDKAIAFIKCLWFYSICKYRVGSKKAYGRNCLTRLSHLENREGGTHSVVHPFSSETIENVVFASHYN